MKIFRFILLNFEILLKKYIFDGILEVIICVDSLFDRRILFK